MIQNNFTIFTVSLFWLASCRKLLLSYGKCFSFTVPVGKVLGDESAPLVAVPLQQRQIEACAAVARRRTPGSSFAASKILCVCCCFRPEHCCRLATFYSRRVPFNELTFAAELLLLLQLLLCARGGRARYSNAKLSTRSVATTFAGIFQQLCWAVPVPLDIRI